MNRVSNNRGAKGSEKMHEKSRTSIETKESAGNLKKTRTTKMNKQECDGKAQKFK